MKPFKSSVLHVVPSPAAFKLTEAFCYSPRNVYLEKVWFCSCCERILGGGGGTELPPRRFSPDEGGNSPKDCVSPNFSRKGQNERQEIILDNHYMYLSE